MRSRDATELVTLAALWGGSFLFMRLGAADFGAVALVFVRVAGACLFLLPLLAWRGESEALRQHWRPLLLMGLINTALPFTLFTLAALALNAGVLGIFNATVPLWGALIAWAWLNDKPGAWRIAGLAIGFAGVLGLAVGKASWQVGDHGISPAAGIAASLAATLCYGFAANYTKKRLSGVPPMAVAAGSQLSAALFTALPAWWLWPSQPPGAVAWASAAVLALACTGIAYILYFRLVAHVGPAQAMTVTYLIPVFAIAWGALLLGETLTLTMVLGCAVILAGTALASGFVGPRQR